MRWPRFLVILALGGLHLAQPGAAVVSAARKTELMEQVRGLFDHGLDSYLKHAFPADELRPLSCRGTDPYSAGGEIKDVCGDYSMTLIDVIDTFVVLGDRDGFERGVRLIIEHVKNFDKDTKVQVFEVTIRVLGGLLSGHLFATDSSINPEFSLSWYRGELLHLATDLGNRLLPAFATLTGMPYARVNLKRGVAHGETVETCTAGAGSLILEFAVLSRLTGDPRYEQAASRSMYALWNRRSSVGLLGNAVSVQHGAWIPPLVSHVGAGSDSFHEYAMKAYILLGEDEYFDVFSDSYLALMNHVRGEEGFWYRGVNMETGARVGVTVDSLAAFLPGLQILAGDVESAIKSHLAYWNLWRRYSGIPESFNVIEKKADNLGYPLRPEFVESTYFLYRATKDELYLEIGERILNDLKRSKVSCGLASFKNLITGELEDRQESFALSETLKYLHLLFDEDNFVNHADSNMVFTTEGHLLHLNASYLRPPSPTRRKLRASEKLACVAYSPMPVSLFGPPDDGHWDDSTFGLRVGVRGRPDWDFGRELVGLPIGRVHEEWSWDPAQSCEVPKEERYTIDVQFDAGGEEEDPSPGPDKLLRINRGYILNSVAGIRAQVARRLDGRGYDVTRLGPHRVRSGQRLYITDPELNDLYDEALSRTAQPISLAPLERDPSIILRFASHTGGSTEVFAHARAGTAVFGGIISPARSASSTHVGTPLSNIPSDNSTPPSQSLFDTDTPPIFLRLPPAHPQNAQGCSKYPFSAASTANLVGSLVLLRRGGCTFGTKLANAREAGASGALIWDTEGSSELIQPMSGSKEDGRWGGGALMYLADGKGAIGASLERKLITIAKENSDRAITVKAIRDEQAGDASATQSTPAGRIADMDDPRRLLWINTSPVLNAMVVRRVEDEA